MENEFVPHKQALALKELGFDFEDYDILGFYSKKYGVTTHSQLTKNDGYNPAPLYQQAFRWFRKKHNIDGLLHKTVEGSYYFWITECEYENYNHYKYYNQMVYFNTYEEAELACLNKLIEIVKTK